MTRGRPGAVLLGTTEALIKRESAPAPSADRTVDHLVQVTADLAGPAQWPVVRR
ncbi:hypothetical protein PUR71_11510 [Streptomyces sp. SP17BM10]|uniref:hypothetical protein n=1 Tax=Streptomyces sp. SP17BM10 TaxID=3002530 RepID=UPI002E766DB5|nr:hypothetical protein [Streptomyces sp. SP17BM10]MEE1783529.1 hypothetical protein [Streptomyces sp. SP17BM10]